MVLIISPLKKNGLAQRILGGIILTFTAMIFKQNFDIDIIRDLLNIVKALNSINTNCI